MAWPIFCWACSMVFLPCSTSCFLRAAAARRAMMDFMGFPFRLRRGVQRRTRALREDAMAGYRRMDAVPEKERAGIRAEGLRIRVHGNARLRDIRQPKGPGRGDDFVQDPEHVETHNVQPGTGFKAVQDRFEPGVELCCEEGGCALSG